MARRLQSRSCRLALDSAFLPQITSPALNRSFLNDQGLSSRLSGSLPTRSIATGTYVSYGLTQTLFEACSAQADYTIPKPAKGQTEVRKTKEGEDVGIGEGPWYTKLDLLPTFSSWSQVTFLHMYLLTVRLRALPSAESVRTHSRHLIDHFSHNAEHRMATLHGISSRSIRNRYLKDLFLQWRGVLAAYDEGLAKDSDAVLAAAVWRNIWKGAHRVPTMTETSDGGIRIEEKEVDWTQIATVVAYMRRVLAELARVDDADLVLVGEEWEGRRPVFGLRESDFGLARM
ncbi:hypothetical protein VTN49DRAFT_3306 [Thermomyces lanuginosus]|uniref:uncharacterized protein n=1 Tax=Thermomyces lanuginosus TaxID=5541 RepID=UPI003743F0DD